MMRLVLLAVAIAMVACTPLEELSRRKRAIPQETIDQLNSWVREAIGNLRTQRIADINKRDGSNEYWMRDIDIRSVTVPTLSAQELSPTTIRVTLSNAGVNVHANWRVKKHGSWWRPSISMSGSVDASASGMGGSVSVSIALQPDGRTKFTLSNCAITVSRVNVNLHGNGIFGFLANFFEGKAEREVKKFLQDKACQLVEREIIKRR